MVRQNATAGTRAPDRSDVYILPESSDFAELARLITEAPRSPLPPPLPPPPNRDFTRVPGHIAKIGATPPLNGEFTR